MTAVQSTPWQSEFGIAEKRSTHFFASKKDLIGSSALIPQAHVLRRAFDLLELDAVLCSDNAPLVYFKQVQKIETQEALRLHRDFWNHGGAPLFVLIDPWNVHLYSGLCRPTERADSNGNAAGFIDELKRATPALQEFLPSVESGDFFRRHPKSFDPKQRVDRDLLDNLQATREKLVDALARDVDPDVLDALLCRLVFTCYLFDRGVIDADYLANVGIGNAAHLRDVLSIKPRSLAKDHLYNKLFKRLGEDFNGDLFSDDLVAESDLVAAKHLDLLEAFFRGTQAKGGQQSFWPYDFGVIPIETISAIYERFLKPSDKAKGAFYTPRFLAEVVLDSLLMHSTELTGKRFLDPACGSGVFLVGVFNRLAEEWTQANPEAKNDRRARELLKLLLASVYGIDINPTACRITAFSLYLAYLDQLSPRGIREIQQKKGALPRLVGSPAGSRSTKGGKNIWCGDFFLEDERYPTGVDFVVGNPPWGSIATNGTPAALWCNSQKPPIEIPDKQIAAAFMRKAPLHASSTGQICLVLPHGTLFNLNAIDFQRDLFTQYAVDRVLNLADYQRFLFEEAGHPALVIVFKPTKPASERHAVDYWAPKVDWSVMRAEIITISPQDRSVITVRDILDDLEGVDAPQIWKRRLWATPRDWRLIDRLSSYPRLRDRVRQTREVAPEKPWFTAEGFQPFGVNDVAKDKKALKLPGRRFVPATTRAIDLFLLESDCIELTSDQVQVRRRINELSIFQAPHVLVTAGFTSIAFANFDVSFQHALRGIHGPVQDQKLLMFLTAYLRSPLARYFLFHTSSSWGVSRQVVGVEEMLRLPFPMPEVMPNVKAAWKIINKVASIIAEAVADAAKPLCNRDDTIYHATQASNSLVDQYFDLLTAERVLVRDTTEVIIPSVRPTQKRPVVPTIMESDDKILTAYTRRLCETLDRWASGSGFAVKGASTTSSKLGIGVTVLQRSVRSARAPEPDLPPDLLATLDRLRRLTALKLNTFELVRGVKAFDGDRLYVVKPLSQRHWTQAAALNDADEIAGSILMQLPEGVA